MSDRLMFMDLSPMARIAFQTMVESVVLPTHMPFPQDRQILWIDEHEYYNQVIIPGDPTLNFALNRVDASISTHLGVKVEWEWTIEPSSGLMTAIPRLLVQPFVGEIRREFFKAIPEEFQNLQARDALMQRMGIAPKVPGSLGPLVRLFPENMESLRKELKIRKGLKIKTWKFGYPEECRDVRTSLIMLATSIQI